MKIVPRFLVILLVVLCAPVVFLHADEPRPTTAAPTSTPPALAKWNVRVEVLMVSLPEPRALALLPDLRDDAKIDAACAQLLEAVKNKEATLTGYPMVQIVSGAQSSSATALEKIYPTQFKGPDPTCFELRHIGPDLTASCQVSDSGEWIQLETSVKRTELVGFDVYGPGKVEQPLFFSTRAANNFAVHSGQRTLVGVHKLVKPEGQMELFILQAKATPAR